MSMTTYRLVPCGSIHPSSAHPTICPHAHRASTPRYPSPTMRYVRFLKTPRITAEKGTNKSNVYCLVNITSDLGDSTLPYDATLVAELISPQQGDQVLSSRCVKWTADMRTLAITLPLKPQQKNMPLRVRVGVTPKATFDTFSSLSAPESSGIVSAWSAEFTSQKEAVKLAERRFQIANQTIKVWEETGESIARHLWYAATPLTPTVTHPLTENLPPGTRA
jgi:hypothetical protein